MLDKQICKIGLLGGTFDPPHWGHLNLALELTEKRNLDEVWFLPAHLNPHKVDHLSASFAQRLAMVTLALQGLPFFKVKDIEGQRPPPSYTIDTVRACLIQTEQEADRPCQFYWMMGADNMRAFDRWHQCEEIVQLVPLLIGARWSHLPPTIPDDQSAVHLALQQGFTQTRLLDIDSTEVRRRLALDLYCAHLLPSPVFNYIKQHHLYHLNQAVKVSPA